MREKFCRRYKKGRNGIYQSEDERIFAEICKKHNLPFRYVGDHSLWIGKEQKLNPDFIEANGKKVVIEIFGAHWHSPLLNSNLEERHVLTYRKKHYSRYKWKSVFLWDTDLRRNDAEAFVLSILKKEGAI